MNKACADAHFRNSCQSRTDLSAGSLNAEQAIEWDGPRLSDSLISSLPDRMDREHFAAVGASALGLMSLRIDAESVRGSFLGWVALLNFGRPITELSASCATRKRLITGGRLARAGPALGSITLTWSMWQLTEDRWRHRLSARVDSYPSRFISTHSTRNPLRRGIAAAYAWYHSVVTCRYLRRLSRSLREESLEISI